MIVTIATLKVNESKVQEFESCFAKLTNAVRESEPDTVLFQLSKSRSESLTYKVVEVYRNEAAVQAHKESSHFRSIAPLLGATFAAPPEVSHSDTVDITCGRADPAGKEFWPNEFSFFVPPQTP